MEQNNENDLHLEQLVLRESIVSAVGLNARSVQIALRGDPSLRETSLERKKYSGPVDEIMPELQQGLQEMLLNRGVFRIFLACNSGEVRTYSIFDPLRMEIHEGRKLTDPEYVDRHFPPLAYGDKIGLMRKLYDYLLELEDLQKMPAHWRRIFARRHADWQPMQPETLKSVIASFKVLRQLPDLYLRNVTLCIVQDLVRLQFNCDGTQIISAEHYKQFMEENF